MNTRAAVLLQRLKNLFTQASKRTAYGVFMGEVYSNESEAMLEFNGYNLDDIQAHLKCYDQKEMLGHLAQFLEAKRERSQFKEEIDSDAFFFNSGLHDIPQELILEKKEQLASRRRGVSKLHAAIAQRIEVDRERFFFTAGACWSGSSKS